MWFSFFQRFPLDERALRECLLANKKFTSTSLQLSHSMEAEAAGEVRTMLVAFPNHLYATTCLRCVLAKLKEGTLTSRHISQTHIILPYLSGMATASK